MNRTAYVVPCCQLSDRLSSLPVIAFDKQPLRVLAPEQEIEQGTKVYESLMRADLAD